jgi:ABC-type branched-subunit amino acid transport system permease subunit
MTPAELTLPTRGRDLRLPFGIALVALACIAPLFLSNYPLHAIIVALIFLLPAHGLNLLLGYTGLLSLAQVENETLGESVGIPTWHYKLVVFMISAAFAGFGGSLYAHYLTVVSPLTFQMYYSTTMLIIVLGGGAGTISGVIFGSLLFVGLTEALRVAPELRMIAYGLLLLGLVFWFPSGFSPLIGRFWSILERRK